MQQIYAVQLLRLVLSSVYTTETVTIILGLEEVGLEKGTSEQNVQSR